MITIMMITVIHITTIMTRYACTLYTTIMTRHYDDRCGKFFSRKVDGCCQFSLAVDWISFSGYILHTNDDSRNSTVLETS